jgi:DNA-directed RNA polymerase specialized sigma24 family protein
MGTLVEEAGPVGIEDRWSPEGLQELRALYEPLRRFAGVVGRWDVEPDDLVQEAYAKVLRRRRADIDDLGPYMRRAIVNLATDERRRAKRGATAVQRLNPDAGSRDAYPHELEDLMRLDGRVRALTYLVEVEGRPIAEAGEMVEMSPTAARVALMRARRRLRAELSVESAGE